MRVLLLAAAAAVAVPRAAEACSTCACGDPTLTVMGAQQPYAHRLRASALVRTSGTGFGPAGARTDLAEQRLELSLAYAPTRWLSVSVTAPLVRRVVDYPNLARDTRLALGDVDARARVFVFRDRDFAPSHLVSVVAGLELPTATELADPGDGLRPLELQIGSGSWDPLAGATYSYFGGAVSAHVVSTVLIPTSGFEGARQGLSWRTRAVAQFQPWTFLGFRAGADSRWDQAFTDPAGAPDPNSGGFVGFATLGLVSSPVPDLIVQASLSVPVVRALRGLQDEAIAATAGAAYDF